MPPAKVKPFTGGIYFLIIGYFTLINSKTWSIPTFNFFFVLSPKKFHYQATLFEFHP